MDTPKAPFQAARPHSEELLGAVVWCKARWGLNGCPWKPWGHTLNLESMGIHGIQGMHRVPVCTTVFCDSMCLLDL